MPTCSIVVAGEWELLREVNAAHAYADEEYKIIRLGYRRYRAHNRAMTLRYEKAMPQKEKSSRYDTRQKEVSVLKTSSKEDKTICLFQTIFIVSLPL